MSAAALLNSFMDLGMRSLPSLRYNAKRKTGMPESKPNRAIGMDRQPRVPPRIWMRFQTGTRSDKMAAVRATRAVFLMSTRQTFAIFFSTVPRIADSP
jgi:hypothetical protein